MRFTYGELLNSNTLEPVTEEVTGAFDCQQDGCYDTVTKAIFMPELNVLTWRCTKEHISRIEDFE